MNNHHPTIPVAYQPGDGDVALPATLANLMFRGNNVMRGCFKNALSNEETAGFTVAIWPSWIRTAT